MEIKSLKLLIFFICCININVKGELCRSPNTKEILWETSYVIMTLIDWGQTKNFRKKGHREKNVILGEKPNQERIDTLIGLGITSHVAIWCILDKEYKEKWSIIFFIIETGAVLWNYDKGHSPKFEINFGIKF